MTRVLFDPITLSAEFDHMDRVPPEDGLATLRELGHTEAECEVYRLARESLGAADLLMACFPDGN